MGDRSSHTAARRSSLDGFFAEAAKFGVGARVRAFRGARKGRAGTVVSALYYGTWFDGQIQGQVDVDYDDSGVPPLKTWLFCLELLSAVDQLGELLNDQG